MDETSQWFGIATDTIQTIAAIIGVFAGGYTGTRLGALSRMRLDDRRSIYDLDLPDISRITSKFAAWSQRKARTSEVYIEIPLDQVRADYEAGVAALERAAVKVALLPLWDRLAFDRVWTAAEDAAAIERSKAFLEVFEVGVTPDGANARFSAWDQRHYPSLQFIFGSVKVSEGGVPKVDRQGDNIGPFVDPEEERRFKHRLAEFETHLARLLRPGLLRNAANWSFRARLLLWKLGRILRTLWRLTGSFREYFT